MSIAVLLIAVFVTCLLIWLIQQGHIAAPFHWIVWGVIVIAWLLVLLRLLGFGDIYIGSRAVG